MPLAVCARWEAREGEEDKVWNAAQSWIAATRQEPGNLLYVVHRDPDNPRVIFFYEQYTDESAFQAHRDSPHFQEHALGVAIPLLESREVKLYEVVDG